MSAEIEIRPTTYAEWNALEEERDRLAAELHAVRAELATSGLSCERCQSSHCCSVAGCTPPLCVTDPEGSLPLWMPWTNEDVRERLNAVYAQVDALQAELARVRRNHLRRMASWSHGVERRAIWYSEKYRATHPTVEREFSIKARMVRFREACRAALANDAKDVT